MFQLDIIVCSQYCGNPVSFSFSNKGLQIHVHTLLQETQRRQSGLDLAQIYSLT